MTKYYVLNRAESGCEWKERKGRKIPNRYGFDLFGEKRERQGYIITEAQSGFVIAQAESQAKALTVLDYCIDRFTLEGVKQKIREVLDHHGESPLYNANPRYVIRNMS